MNVEYLIGEEESIRTLIEITERLDYSKLKESYNRLPNEKQASITRRDNGKNQQINMKKD